MLSMRAFGPSDTMIFAYADPPYIGCAKLYPEKTEVEHGALIQSLIEGYDGWALSASSPSIYQIGEILSELGVKYRMGVWVKPFAIFKPNVNPAYTWEPVFFSGGRKRKRTQPTVRDWLSCNITLRKGLVGAKPPEFCRWILDLMNFEDGDKVHDLFPGTSVMGNVVASYITNMMAPPDFGLFKESA